MVSELKLDTERLLQEAKKSILYTANRPNLVMEKGQGVYLWDTDGNKYLDFIGGWAVTSLGHCPEVITRVLAQQSVKLINASPAFYNVPMIEFAKLLTDNSCFDKVFFASTGAEANEGAIKLARKYGAKYLNGAYEIITAIDSFHGRTLATMSATGKQKWENLFEPKVQGFKHVPQNDVTAMQNAVSDNTCAIMLEPVQGEGGVFELDKAYIQSLRKLCNENNILLIVDEVQTGIGRTGKLFAYEHYDVEPDVMTLAKGIGGGYPLAALLCKEKFDVFEAGDQGGTYSGQPLGMAVGMAVVNEIIDKNLIENAVKQGAYILQQLTSIASRFQLTNIRGKGLLIAFDLPTEKGGEVVSECQKRGLLVNSPRPAYIRLMPPLTVTSREIDEMIAKLSEVLAEVVSE
ncbi:MAG: acetylornithine/succinylornithine aminotransferase [Firmicutes bacterium]|nr:acetylornithine/succinylornithine aminotransferase [Bacillota bacterium]